MAESSQQRSETCAFIRLHILTHAFISKPLKVSEKSMLPCQRGLEESTELRQRKCNRTTVAKLDRQARDELNDTVRGTGSNTGLNPVNQAARD